MTVVAPVGADPGAPADEAFPALVQRGTEALAGGDAAAARAALERALELRPKDAKALALLGRACYRQGRFDDAVAAWQRLVDDNPVEPAARVNLGLAFLKGKRHAEARKQLEIALDLDPEHRKAMNYLGLALLESGSPVDAREWFRKAGSDQMVARCDDVIAGGWQSVALPAVPEEPLGTPVPGALPTLDGAAAAPSLAAWSAERRLRAADAPFATRDGVLAVAVRGQVLVRLDGLLALRGRVALAGELKRFRGRAIDQAFGEGTARVHRASGEGEIVVAAAGRRFTALELGGEAVYLREEVVFGLEAGLAFENGRVPSSAGAGLDLVHLRGRGRFVLVTAGEPLALDVVPGAPLRVSPRALVGWTGALTPRIVPLGEPQDEASAALVELTGEGRVLADPAALGAGA